MRVAGFLEMGLLIVLAVKVCGGVECVDVEVLRCISYVEFWYYMFSSYFIFLGFYFFRHHLKVWTMIMNPFCRMGVY